MYSYIYLGQAHASKQSSMKALSLKINKCLNKTGYPRKDQYFAWKLRREAADSLYIGDKNVMEDMRSRWTTFTNLNLWFSTREKILIDLGFGRMKREGENCDGSVVFFKGQTDQSLIWMRLMDQRIMQQGRGVDAPTLCSTLILSA